MALKGFIFDFNGTLFQDTSYHVEAVKSCLAAAGKPVLPDAELVRRMFGMDNGTIYRRFFNADATEEEWRAYGRVKEQAYRDKCMTMGDAVKMVDGAEELLNYLKENCIPYALATGSPRDNVDFYNDVFGLERWFTAVNMVYDDGTVKGKPAPDVYLKAAEKIGLKPEECVVFEDGLQGMLAAKAAGVTARVALFEACQPDPTSDEVDAVLKIHDLKDWRRLVSVFLNR